MNETINLQLFDTSLRDGAQKYKDYPTGKQAALIAYQLAKLGIWHIEIWVPVAENQSKERLEMIIKAVEESWENPVLYWFCRCVKNDIDAVLSKMETAKNKWVNIVVSWSELFQILRDGDLKNKKRDNLSPEEISIMEDKILESIKEQVSYAKKFFYEVRVCFEDGSMWKRNFLVKAIKTAWENGAWVVSIPDTLWGVLPNEIKDLFEYIISKTKNVQEKGMKFAIHAHDDRKLALANSLAAIEAWATSVEWTLLWSWERVWNLNLKDIIWNIYTLIWRIIKWKDIICDWIKLNKLYETYKIIYALLWKQWDPNTPFVWEQSTMTQVWIHQSLENKSSSELVEFFKKYWRYTPYSLIDLNQFWVPQLWLNMMYTNLSWFSNLEACLNLYWVTIEKNSELEKNILNWLKADLDNTKVVYASRIYTEYLIQSWIINILNEKKDIKICNNKINITLSFWSEDINLEALLTNKDWVLWASVIAINNYLNPDYWVNLTDFSLRMQEWEHRIAERHSSLKNVFKNLWFTNGDEQMWIAHIEWLFTNIQNNDQIPFITTAHDLHWNHANIKALIYGCLPLIYEKFLKEKS